MNLQVRCPRTVPFVPDDNGDTRQIYSIAIREPALRSLFCAHFHHLPNQFAAQELYYQPLKFI